MTRAALPSHLPGEVHHRRAVAPDGIRLAVVEIGPADAPAEVVAHGAGSSARFVAAAFAGPVLAVGRRLVTYDLRGHGASTPVTDPTAHALGRQVADLAAVVTGTAGIVASVGGVSLGAHAAARWAVVCGWGAASVPGRRVLACLPAWSGAHPAGTVHAAVADEVRRVGVPGVLRRLRAERALPGWLRDALTTDYARHDPDSLGAALVALDGAAAPGPDELGRLEVALDVVAWPDDPAHPVEVARTWHAATARGRLTEIAMTDLEGDLEALGRGAIATP